MSVVYCVIIYSFSFFKTDHNLYLSGIVIILLGFSSIDWLYTGLSDFRSLTIRSLIIKIFSLLFLYIFIKSYKDYYSYFLLTILSILGGNFINIIFIKSKIRFRLSGLRLKRHFKPLLLVFGIGLGTSMYTVLDTVLLGFLTYPKIVGLYTSAVKLCKIFMPFISVLGVVLMPEISKKTTRDNITDAQFLLEKSFGFIVFFCVPVSFGLFLLAPEIIYFFSGRQFSDAVSCMKILSVLPFLLGIGYFLASQVLIPSGRDKEVFLSVLIGFVTCISLNFLLVPKLLQNGAAIANVVTELVVNFFYFFYIKKHFKFNLNISVVFKAIISSLLFIPLIFVVRWFHFPAFLCIVIYASVCFTIYTFIQYLVFKDETINQLYILATARFQPGRLKVNK
jgi:O-antigen/teichoic acid export membrane protein